MRGAVDLSEDIEANEIPNEKQKVEEIRILRERHEKQLLKRMKREF